MIRLMSQEEFTMAPSFPIQELINLPEVAGHRVRGVVGRWGKDDKYLKSFLNLR